MLASRGGWASGTAWPLASGWAGRSSVLRRLGFCGGGSGLEEASESEPDEEELLDEDELSLSLSDELSESEDEEEEEAAAACIAAQRKPMSLSSLGHVRRYVIV